MRDTVEVPFEELLPLLRACRRLDEPNVLRSAELLEEEEEEG